MLGKSELRDAIAGLNRGILASDLDRRAIMVAIAQLEGRNPTPCPLEAPELLDGNWRLLYTTSQELLGIDRFPLLTLGQIYQCVRLAEQRIYNIAEVKGPPGLDGIVSVSASFKPVSPLRVDVYFERGVFGLQRLLGYAAPNAFIQDLQANPKLPLFKGIDFTITRDRPPGWLEITYLDADMRIGRGNEGNVFVLSKSP